MAKFLKSLKKGVGDLVNGEGDDSNFSMGGLLGSAVHGLKDAMGDNIPTDIIPEDLNPSELLDAAKESLPTDMIPEDLNPSELLDAAKESLPTDMIPEDLNPSELLDAAKESLPTDMIPEDLNPSELLDAAKESLPTDMIPEDLNPSELLDAVKESLPIDGLPEEIDSSKLLSPLTSSFQSNASSNEDEPKSGRKGKSGKKKKEGKKDKKGGKKKKKKGLLGSTLGGLKKAASGTIPTDLDPSQLLDAATESLPVDGLLEGLSPSKLLSPLASPFHSNASSNEDEPGSGKKGKSGKKKKKGGFLGSAVGGLKEAASGTIPTDFIPEDLDPSQLVGAARNSLPTNLLSNSINPSKQRSPSMTPVHSNSSTEHMKSPGKKSGFLGSTFGNLKKTISGTIPSEIPEEMDDLTDSLHPPAVKKFPSKSLPTSTLPEGFDPSKFLSPLYKPAGKAKKNKSRTSLESGEHVSPTHSVCSFFEPTAETAFNESDLYIGGGVRKFSKDSPLESDEEKRLVGKVNKFADESGLFLDVKLVTPSHKPVIMVEDEPIQQELDMEEEPEEKPEKKRFGTQQATLLLSAISTALVSLNLLSSVGLNSLNNVNTLRQNRQQMMNRMNDSMPANMNMSNATNSTCCCAEELEYYFDNLNMSIASLGELLYFQPGFTTLTNQGEIFNNPAESCQAIKEMSPSLPSGMYWITPTSMEDEEEMPMPMPTQQYCDMQLECGGTKGGWMRIAHFDTRDITFVCPKGFKVLQSTFEQYDFLNRGSYLQNLRTCGIDSDANDTCSKIEYDSPVLFDKICGRVIGYQYGEPTGFRESPTMDSLSSGEYVDGVSLTYGDPAQHIWTFAAASNQEPENMCPCGSMSSATHPPEFVDGNYFCDSAVESGTPEPRVYPEDPLWEGLGCNGTLTNCCSFNKPPWFHVSLEEQTSANIKLALCREQTRAVADVGIQILDIFVR